MNHIRMCPGCDSENYQTLAYPEGRIFSCRNCGLEWSKLADGSLENIVEVQKAEGISFYLSSRSYGDVNRYPPFLEFLKTVRKLKSEQRLNILDVGCGSGQFIRFGIENGLNVYGVELNTDLKKEMSSEIEKRITFQPIETIEKFPVNNFDMITFWDCFEHLESAFATLNVLKKHLNPDGVVFLRVNNQRDIYNIVSRILLTMAPSLGKKVYKSCFNFPQHAWNFSYNSMEKLLKKHNWEIIDFHSGETPAFRLTPNPILQLIFKMAYLFNWMIRGGKVGIYYIKPR